MRRIVVTNTKGGVGKTTTAIFLATALSERGSVVVWDADAQGSATEWALRASETGNALPFDVAAMNTAQLRRAEAEEDFAIIDTAPGDWRGIDAALDAADVAILPTAPSGLDIDRLWETERVASQRCISYVLITLADRRTSAPDAALEALDTQGVGYFETVIPLREPIRQGYGHRIGVDLFGYQDVAAELLEAMAW